MTYLSLNNIVTRDDESNSVGDPNKDGEDQLIQLPALQHLFINNCSPPPQFRAPLLTTLSMRDTSDYYNSFDPLRLWRTLATTSQLTKLTIDEESDFIESIDITDFPEITLSNLNILRLHLEGDSMGLDLGVLQSTLLNVCNPLLIRELSITFGHQRFAQPPPLELFTRLTALNIFFTWACRQDHKDIGEELLRWLEQAQSLRRLTITGVKDGSVECIFFDPLNQILLQPLDSEKIICPKLDFLGLYVGNLNGLTILFTIYLQRAAWVHLKPFVMEIDGINQLLGFDAERFKESLWWTDVTLRSDKPELFHSFSQAAAIGLGYLGSIEGVLKISSPEERLDYICGELQPAISRWWP